MAADKPAGGDPLLAGLPKLIRALAAEGVTELEVAVGAARLFVRQRLTGGPPPTSFGPGPSPAAAETEDFVAVVTPLAGVFYASSGPEEPPFVVAGDEVEAGQVVALIEAMKVFNEIRTEVAGTVVEIACSPGQSVQAGQALVLIRPHEAADVKEAGAQ